jgi:hypothetical protein
MSNHVGLGETTIYSQARLQQVQILQDTLAKRATLYQDAHTLLTRIQTVIENKLLEWIRLLETEQRLRSEYYEGALQAYYQRQQAYQEAVTEAERNGTPAPLPPAGLPYIPTVPGFEREEKRITTLLNLLRRHVTDTAKILSMEQGYMDYVKLELEMMLKDLATESIEEMQKISSTLIGMVPPDQQKRAREILRESALAQNKRFSERFQILFRTLARFSSQVSKG